MFLKFQVVLLKIFKKHFFQKRLTVDFKPRKEEV